MRIQTLWKMWDDENVELLFALDEYTVENNWEAWQDGVTAACEQYKIVEADTRVVLIEINYAPIAAAFRETEITGTIVVE